MGLTGLLSIFENISVLKSMFMQSSNLQSRLNAQFKRSMLTLMKFFGNFQKLFLRVFQKCFNYIQYFTQERDFLADWMKKQCGTFKAFLKHNNFEIGSKIFKHVHTREI